MSLHLPRLDDDPLAPFPPVASALRRPDGLLAFGGDLSVARLANAYRQGIFPWYSQGQPILWWSPDPRTVFETATFALPRRFARQLRRSDWQVRADTAFEAVVAACASAPRPGQDGTWITDAMQAAYAALHRAGLAHSIEVFAGDRLVGGVYGVAIGRMFFGESMFSEVSGGSKLALGALARQLHRWQMPLIDAQVGNPHLEALGAAHWPRPRFAEAIAALVEQPPPVAGAWTQAFGVQPAATFAERAAETAAGTP
ncbi:leucyl/phenylalanyl-tRNA--protein transferase [Luteimonas sp. S4-F44]|uniref:leucyl/phenylalanyl-tRNA--protein transferase n=1 Tax=Luteimonas sp. S4-F44 TaxID=2925842 RepID=UPI001F5397CA|nr:leucyl/phenylalanyl-tRNA--protein transferase [Luteimonas sp. S4-F44]UNK44131.1 leucyl/phenylalanyl-tRNA--protein transferase [Luteimonas sp. S4-F44]